MEFNISISIFLSIIGIIILFILKKNRVLISKKLDLIDKPNNLKINNKNTPLIGSFAFFFLFTFLSFSQFFYNDFDLDNILIFIICCFSFLVGLVDDRKNLSYKSKFIYFGLAIVLVLIFSNNLVLDKIYFESFNKIFFLESFNSVLVTLLCLLLFINAMNLSDGINGLCSGLILIWMSYLNFKYDLFMNFYPLIIILLISTYFIYKGVFFLGNSGSHFLSTFIGIVAIKTYNNYLNLELKNTISVEEIFILFMLPGLDMLRLFIVRIINKKNPFSSDLNHLHHLLLNKFSLLKSLLIYFLSTISPILIYNFTNIEPLSIIIVFFLFYFMLILFLKKKLIL